MPISFERAFSLHDDALLLRGRRAAVLASNIANADTPGYKARDFDFAATLAAAGHQTGGAVRLAGTHRDHIVAPSRGAADTVDLKYRNPLHPSLDGNSVDAHVEQAKFAENALLMQTSFTFLNGKISGLMKALKGE